MTRTKLPPGPPADGWLSGPPDLPDEDSSSPGLTIMEVCKSEPEETPCDSRVMFDSATRTSFSQTQLTENSVLIKKEKMEETPAVISNLQENKVSNNTSARSGITLHGYARPGVSSAAEANVSGSTPVLLLVRCDTTSNGCKADATSEPATDKDKHATFVCGEDYPGEFGLQLRFCDSGMTKSVSFTYSPILDKLFCQVGKTCPVKVLVGKLPPPGAVVRATAVYKKSEHVGEAVRCCPHHQLSDTSDQRAHIIRIEGNQRVQYEEDPANQRLSAVRPFYERPHSLYSAAGAHTPPHLLLLKFMCKSSCMGGMNRRPILAIVTLESAEGRVLGRRVFEVRVCACPGRDRKHEESTVKSIKHQGRRRTPAATPAASPAPLTEKLNAEQSSSDEDEDDDEVFIIRVRGRKRYAMLRKINEGLELREKYKKNG